MPPTREHAELKTTAVSTMKNIMEQDSIFCNAEEIFLRNLPVVFPATTMKTVGTSIVEQVSELGLYEDVYPVRKPTAVDHDELVVDQPSSIDTNDSDKITDEFNDVSEDTNESMEVAEENME